MKTAGLQQTRPCTCLRQKKVGGKLQALVYDILPSSKVPERKRCSPRRKDVVNLCLESGLSSLRWDPGLCRVCGEALAERTSAFVGALTDLS